MTTLSTPPTRQIRRKQERNIREMFEFQCSLPWFAATLGAGSAAALALHWGGLPVAAVLGTVGMAGLTYATLVEPRLPVLEETTLRLPTLPPQLDGLRIGQLTDLHLGMPHSHANTRWGVQRIMDEAPDVIVITGDFVSFHHAISQLPGLLQPLQAPLGVYAITGNHDHWEGVAEIRAQLEPLGITFLMNEHRCLPWNGGELWLAGIDDMWYGAPDLAAALNDIPATAFTLLLAHEPDFADVVVGRGVALQLSGHTHGGHIRLPLLGAPCLPSHGVRYSHGLVHVGALQIYVSRGLGGFPLRLNCPPEVSLLTLRCG